MAQANKPAVFRRCQKLNQDEILDGGKDLPYRQKTNSQGLRMDFDLAEAKSKQRVLVMGDSQINCPFFDNQFTITGLLQAKFADAEIANTAIVGYSLDDRVSLFEESKSYGAGYCDRPNEWRGYSRPVFLTAKQVFALGQNIRTE